VSLFGLPAIHVPVLNNLFHSLLLIVYSRPIKNDSSNYVWSSSCLGFPGFPRRMAHAEELETLTLQPYLCLPLRRDSCSLLIIFSDNQSKEICFLKSFSSFPSYDTQAVAQVKSFLVTSRYPDEMGPGDPLDCHFTALPSFREPGHLAILVHLVLILKVY
jgi:hypothetical protein